MGKTGDLYTYFSRRHDLFKSFDFRLSTTKIINFDHMIPTPALLSTTQLEAKLRQQKDPLLRLLLTDQLAGHYAYTNVRRARELLMAQHELLRDFPNQDAALNYHLHLATIENHLYHFEEAEQHFLQAMDILEEIGTVVQQAEIYIDYAGTCMNLDRKEEAGQLLDKASKLLSNFPDEHLMAHMTCREGFMHLHYSDYSKAIELLLEAEKLLSALPQPLPLKDYYFLTLVYSGLGRVYERNDELEKSVQAYLRVVDMCESIGMRARISWHYLNVGNGYMALNDLDNAELYFQKAIHARDDASQNARAAAYANLGYCCLENQRYAEALELLDKAEVFYKKEDHYNLSIIEAWRGRLFAEAGEPEEALEHFELAYEYAENSQDFKQLASVCQDIAEFYADEEDFKSAYEYQVQHGKFAEKYMLQVNRRKQMELEVKYEADKKRQETELLRLESVRLQLKALRAQMNPHFMYNALNSIQNFISSNQSGTAEKYLAQFAQLMRQSLDYSDLEVISLEKEIEFLKDYLYINQKLRFNDNLAYEVIIEDDIEEDIMGVPTMIVQPYVENSIEHGLRSQNGGLIRVSFSLLDEENMLCVVEDNGVGREKARQIQAQDARYQNHKSKGTNITEKRLQILHHAKEPDIFVETIDLRDEKTGEALGTRVKIKIPVVAIHVNKAESV